MKKYNIYIGTIKKCLNSYSYREHGDKYYQGSYQIGGIEVGSMIETTLVIKKDAIVIDTNNGYLWLKDVKNDFEILLANQGLSNKTLADMPTCDNEIFVDKKSLVPFYKDDYREKIKVKHLRKDSRINSYTGTLED